MDNESSIDKKKLEDFIDKVMLSSSNNDHRSIRLFKSDVALESLDEDFLNELINHMNSVAKSPHMLVSTQAFLVFVFLYVIVIVFGLISNLTIITTFYKCKRLRTFRNAYIVNLAISLNMNWRFGSVICKLSSSLQVVIVLVSCFSMASIAIDRWQFIVHSSSTSSSTSTSSTSSSCSSPSTTSCTSASSSSYIIDPLGSRVAAKRARLFITIGFVWLLALLISLPLMFVCETRPFTISNDHINEMISTVCEEVWPSKYPYHYFKHVYSIVLFLFQFLLPVSIIGMSNYKICQYLHFKIPIIYRSSEHRYSERTSCSPDSLNDATKSNAGFEPKKSMSRQRSCWEGLFVSWSSHSQLAHSSFSQNHSRSISVQEELLRRQRNRRYSKSCRILFYVFASFSLCWLPSALLNLIVDYQIFNFKGYHHELTIAWFIVNLIAVSSVCLNPILYGLLNRNFNIELANLLGSIRRRTNSAGGAGGPAGSTKSPNRRYLNRVAIFRKKKSINQSGVRDAAAGDSAAVLTDRNLSTHKNSPCPTCPVNN